MAAIDLESQIDCYCQILAPLFECTGDRFDYVLALLRATGQEGAGWDTLSESFQMLDDLLYLTMVELPTDPFGEPEVTRLRLSLLMYCHLVEMDAPYDIIANLCRVRLGQAVSNCPFLRRAKKWQQKSTAKSLPAKNLYPAQKIEAIKTLTKQVDLPAIGTAFDDFYRAGIRNAISHSDYIIHGTELRMRSQSIPAEDGTPGRTHVVKIDRLQELIYHARAFYMAFVRVEKGARLTVGINKGRGFPYDRLYKGILEILADEEGYLCGVVIHWPNGTESSYMRTVDGSKPMNILPRDGALEAFVGENYSPHAPFSLLLKPGQGPQYTPLRGSNDSLQWQWDNSQK